MVCIVCQIETTELHHTHVLYIVLGEDRYTQMCKQISHVISSKDQRAIIYVDFVKDAAPLAISLRQAGYSTCSYHGQKLSSHDKLQSIEAWRNGSVKVMVCTTAFGMGTDQPDVEIVIRIRCLPTLESMVQEFGRAERDGRLAKGTQTFPLFFNRYVPNICRCFVISRK